MCVLGVYQNSVPAGTFFQFRSGFGSRRNLKNWFRCTPSVCVRDCLYVDRNICVTIVALPKDKLIKIWLNLDEHSMRN